MEFMLFICTDPSAPAYNAAEDNIGEWVDGVQGRGVWRHGDRLRPAADARTVTVRDGKTIVTDGPFTASLGGIAGYDVIDCRDADEAIEIASKHPMARFGKVEVRPVWPIEE